MSGQLLQRSISGYQTVGSSVMPGHRRRGGGDSSALAVGPRWRQLYGTAKETETKLAGTSRTALSPEQPQDPRVGNP